MKTILISLCAASILLFSNFVEARGAGHGGGYSGRTHSSSSSSYKSPKLYKCSGCNSNDHHVEPHVRKNGEFVQGHMKTDSNETRIDNFTQRGNINPYTGKPGDRD
ncbi:MAG: hypothetical protein HY272_12510 [Gammaproteobacteria bacterium]|nr:hypothetical protein [Gammaproteobacteria bacterium]